jgi:hypothetical protein
MGRHAEWSVQESLGSADMRYLHDWYDAICSRKSVISVGIFSLKQSSQKVREHFVSAGRPMRDQLFHTLFAHSAIERKHLAFSWVHMHSSRHRRA